MQTNLDTDLMAGMLKSKRADKGLRAIAEEIGDVSAATLSRIEQGKIPDVDTFIRICKWLEVSTDTFILANTKKNHPSNKEQVVAHLRADRVLSKRTIDMLIDVIDMAYQTK